MIFKNFEFWQCLLLYELIAMLNENIYRHFELDKVMSKTVLPSYKFIAMLRVKTFWDIVS